MKLSESGKRVIEARFLQRDDQFHLIENADQMCERVSGAIANAEKDPQTKSLWKKRFHEMLDSLEFLPNSPTLANAGTAIKQLSACFVLPVPDSMEGIFDALKWMALIQQSGGGTGFDFSELRAEGSRVTKTGGKASGPVSFMRIFDAATENIRQGGRRRGANMGILRVDHPDIRSFIAAKRIEPSLRNFNLSIGITADFRASLGAGETKVLRLFDEICEAAWASGDPGLIFLDRIEAENPTPALGRITATNPCGEVPLLPFEACNLGSIHLGKCVQTVGRKTEVHWKKLEALVGAGVRFLDNVIEVSEWPIPQIDRMVRGNRKIGLGVMGFAELLLKLDLAYGSPESVALADRVMAFIKVTADAVSGELAEERGVFPHWEKSVFKKSGQKLRNATRTSIAPTGTIGIVAGTSSGIEPLFALAYHRNALDGQVLTEVNPLFEEAARKLPQGEKWIAHVKKTGSMEGAVDVPLELKRTFVTALQIAPESHLDIQEAFQRHTDNAVSKTINLPETATVNDVKSIYHSAFRRSVKGITIYRYGSKGTQVLNLGTEGSGEAKEHFVKCDPKECAL